MERLSMTNIGMILALLFFIWLLVRLSKTIKGSREGVKAQEFGKSEKS